MNKTFFTAKGWLLLVSLLVLCLVQARGQTTSGTQIVGYNNANNMSTIASLANSPYTTIIDGFLEPTQASTAVAPALGFDTLSYSSTMDAARVTAFNSLRNAGKNVLLSFGGAGAGSSYAIFAKAGTTSSGIAYTADQATQNLANILAAYVTGASSYQNAITGATVPITTYDHSAGTFRGFNGIDLDFEDTQSFQTQGSPTYDGVHFLSQLTIDLRNNLGSGYLITHAPQTVYLDPAYTQGNTGTYGLPSGGYQAVLTTNYANSNPNATLTAAGQATSWLNVQFYNNSADDGNNSVSGVVQAFENLVTENPSIPTSKFVLTLPVTSKNAGDNFFTGPEITQIVKQINAWLTGRGKGTIAGVAGFELYQPGASQQDTYNTDLNFANAIVLGTHPAFFTGEAALSNGVYYLAFPNNGNLFGYYSYLSDPHYIYHFDLGYEYIFDAADGKSGVYLYDFKSGGYFYTSPSFPFPYLYDFSLSTTLYYYPDPNNPGRYNTNGVRYFYNFATGKIITK